MEEQSDWWTILPSVQLLDWCHTIVYVRVQQTWIINCSMIPILNDTLPQCFTECIFCTCKTRAKALLHSQINISIAGSDSISLPPPTERANQFRIAKQQGKHFFPFYFTPEYLIMNLCKQKFQSSHCSNSLLPEVLSSPQLQNRGGGVEPQHFRQSALNACYSLFSCRALFIFCVSNNSHLLERCFLEKIKIKINPFIQRNENIWKQEQKLNASRKQQKEAVICDQGNHNFFSTGCIKTENTDKEPLSYTSVGWE